MHTPESEDAQIEKTHNTARFFVDNRHIAWVLLIATAIWGWFGYHAMPQRKDPDVQPREAVALCPWPGASAEKIEQLVTRKIEAKIAENSKIETITSNTRTGLTIITITLDENVPVGDRPKEFDDIRLKLDAIRDLPSGAGPIQFIKDFGDVATLLLTVASPPADDIEIALRAATIRRGIEAVRREAAGGGAGVGAGDRIAVVFSYADGFASEDMRPHAARFAQFGEVQGVFEDARVFAGPGFLGVDARTTLDAGQVATLCQQYLHERLRAAEIHPDLWGPVCVADPAETEESLRAVAGDKYSHRELEDYVELIERTLRSVPEVSKVTISGTLAERVYLHYSQERLAAYGIQERNLAQILGARNITPEGGVVEVGDRNMRIDASGEFQSEQEIGDVLVPVPDHGTLYLRDVVQITRAYESPPRFLNFYSRPQSPAPAGHGAAGAAHAAAAEDAGVTPAPAWQRTRAVTLSIQMRAGEQVARFDHAVDEKLAELEARLPDDLVMARTSDQPQQVEENIHLFMSSLWEAIILVVLVSLVGFWEWRSALLMALSIPITLAMTFGMIQALGIDLQQVSIASLIIALGLLVDDPVVAGDAIKRDLALGRRRDIAAWWGPTKLAKAIMYATLTNIAAYLPFLLLTGETGNFIYSLPVVIACSLVASRLVSMTFIPFLGYYLLRPKSDPSIEERRRKGFSALYYRVGSWAIDHRWPALGLSLVFLVGGVLVTRGLKTQFFPKDLQYLSTVDVWLPEDATLSATHAAARQTEAIIRDVADAYGAAHPEKDGRPRQVLASLTTFVGGGAPRFWSSVVPEQSQTNYATIIIQVRDKHDTNHLIEPIQEAVDAQVPGARIDVRQIETGAAIGIPLAIRISGEDAPTLRQLAAQVTSAFHDTGIVVRARDDWGAESFSLRFGIDVDRANLVGVTNEDVAGASIAALNGTRVALLRDGHKQIPVIARLEMHERAQAGDVENLYVYASRGTEQVPLSQISKLDYGMQTERIQRRQQFRTITVSAFPRPGVLPSEALAAVMPELRRIERELPLGFHMEIAGEHGEQAKSFRKMAMVMLMSVLAIFITLVIQFKHAFKPLVVFAAIPFGIVGALICLRIMGTPFGFMAFMGVASLVGVIVSHVIVLFDFIEEAHEHGASLRDALLDAGIVRLRPVLITVGATVIALFPLASHGGPLWEPLCYTQIGGLITATFVTLLLVPVLYSIFVHDLKLIRWSRS